MTISGGTIHVNASGDGLDSNGTLTVSGGTVTVSGPTSSANGALDYGDGSSASISGGTLVAAGSSGMADTFGDSSTQYSFLLFFDGTVTGGTELTVTDSSGHTIAQYTPEKDYQSVVVSSPDLKDGETYTVTAGDTTKTVTLSGVSTTSGSQGSQGGTFPNGGGNMGQRGDGNGGPGGGNRPSSDTTTSATPKSSSAT